VAIFSGSGAVRSIALALIVVLSPGCATFNDGIADAFEQDVSDEYSWGRELYELPLGMIGLALFLGLSPFLYWIPDKTRGFGYVLGRAFGDDFLYLDPTKNYHGG
jgi:hypothetical protein